MNNKGLEKREWVSPTLTSFGDVQTLTQGDPVGTPKGLGVSDEIIGQVNPPNNGISAL